MQKKNFIVAFLLIYKKVILVETMIKFDTSKLDI